jgi:predicted MFS family arabinose efflux permease
MATEVEKGADRTPSVAQAAIAGLAALLIGIGLSRFAFTPLVPALVQAGWSTPSEVGYLGAANLTGYLVGAVLARRLPRRLRPVALAKLAMAVGTVSFFACAMPLGFVWFFFWRLMSGIIGGVLMVLVPTAVLAVTPVARRGRVAGIVFTGVGAGIALAGTVIPPLVTAGLTVTWAALGVASFLLMIVAWVALPPSDMMVVASSAGTRLALTPAVTRLLLSYTLIGFAFAPHTVFWIDFIARGLGKGLGVGGGYWVVLGAGAACGPMLTGFLAERLGFARTYTLVLLIFALCVALPIAWSSALALTLTSFGVGAFGLATTSLGSGRASELVPINQHRQLWSWMTIGYAVAYAAGAYLCAYIFAETASYRLIFAFGGAAGLLSALLAWSSRTAKEG